MSTIRLLKNIIASAGLRAINLGSTLIMVPLTLSGLGMSDYGILAVVISATAFFGYADFGFSLAIVNRVAADIDGSIATRSAVSRAFFFLCAIAIVLVVTVFFVSACLLTYYNSPTIATESWALGLCSVAAGLPTALCQRILFALQRNVEAGLWNGFARVASVLAVAVAWYFHCTLVGYVAAILLVPVVVGWANTAWFFAVVRRDLLPLYRLFSIMELKDDAATGFQYVTLQAAVFVETGMDNIIIGLIKGASSVTHYDILWRLFNYVPAFVSIGAFPLWPALRAASVKGDIDWYRRTLLGAYVAVGLFATIGSAVLFNIHPILLSFWTHRDFAPDFLLALSLAIFSVMTSLSTVQGMALNALGKLPLQAKFHLYAVPATLLIKPICLSFFGTWSLGIVVSILYALRMYWFNSLERQSRDRTERHAA